MPLNRRPTSAGKLRSRRLPHTIFFSPPVESALPGQLFWDNGFVCWRGCYPEPDLHERLLVTRCFFTGLRRRGGARFVPDKYRCVVDLSCAKSRLGVGDFLKQLHAYGGWFSPPMRQALGFAWFNNPSKGFEFSVKYPARYKERLWERLREKSSKWDRKEYPLYFKRRKWIQFIEDIWRALWSAIHMSRLSLSLDAFRVVNSIRVLLIKDPELVLRQLLKLASEARTRGISGVRKKCPYEVIIRNCSRKKVLSFSYLKRSLPPFINNPDPIQKFIDTVTSEPVYEDCAIQDFKSWVTEWARNHHTVAMDFTPTWPSSTSACFYRTRMQGGQSDLYKEIVDYQASRVLCGLHSKYDDQARSDPAISRYFDNRNLYSMWIMGGNMHKGSWPWFMSHIKSKLLIYGCLNLIYPMIEHAPCDGNCGKTGLHPFVRPVTILERGGKVRVPTKSLVPFMILGNILKESIRPLMKCDRRISESLRDTYHFNMTSRAYWRSVDVSGATDNHPFILTRSLYEGAWDAIGDPYPWARDVLKVITGPVEIYTGKPLLQETFSFRSHLPKKRLILPKWVEEVYERTPNLYKNAGITRKILHKSLKKTVARSSIPLNVLSQNTRAPQQIKNSLESAVRIFSNKFLELRNQWDYRGTSKKGQMMGTPTSWNALPLVSLWAYERATGRKATSRDLKTCGDDAFGSFWSEQESEQFTTYMESIGSHISVGKDHLTKDGPDGYGVFVEIILYNGKPLGLMPYAYMVSPSRGVGKCNWYTAPNSVYSIGKRVQATKSEIRRVFDIPTFHGEWELASRLGMPTHYPYMLGGINIPNSVVHVNEHFRDKIYTYFAGKSTMELLDPRGKLSLLDAHLSGSALTSAFFTIKDSNLTLSAVKTTPDDILLKDLLGALSVPEFAIGVFGGTKYNTDLKRPFVYNCVARLRKKLQKVRARPASLPPHCFEAEINAKLERYVQFELSPTKHSNPLGLFKDPVHPRVRFQNGFPRGFWHTRSIKYLDYHGSRAH